MTQIVDTAPEDQTSLPLPSRFRMWVNNNWVKNTEEHLIYGEQPYTITEYWFKFKWWLRREYRQQLQKEHERKKTNEQFRQWS
jgi:hypothetical protein